jgi:hypothetical protein
MGMLGKTPDEIWGDDPVQIWRLFTWDWFEGVVMIPYSVDVDTKPSVFSSVQLLTLDKYIKHTANH